MIYLVEYKTKKEACMKIKKNLLLIIMTAIFIAPISTEELKMTPEEGFQIEETKGFVFQWKIENEKIQVILSAPTLGWLAVGFNPSRMMKDANIIMGYVKDGKVYMEDHFGSGNTRHTRDIDLGGTDDITIIDGSEENDITTLQFSIPLHSWDSNDQKLEKGVEYKIIFAYGKKDDFKSYHKLRTSLMITL